MKEERHYLTKEGLRKAREKLEKLQKARLSKIKKGAPAPLDYQDVDPEYLAYQEEMGRLERMIYELKKTLENYEIIRIPSKKKRNKVYLGAMVMVEIDGTVEKIKIVDEAEADPFNQKISVNSPIGRAMLGKKAGEEFKVKTPIFESNCRILKIRYE